MLNKYANTRVKKHTDQAYSSAYSGEIVIIEVGTGQDTRVFYAHRSLLTFYSGYFRAALDGGFAESRSGVIKLDCEECSVFERFVTWLYTYKTRPEKITEGNPHNHFLSCVKLWVFADRRDIPLLMNEMVDELQKIVVETWTYPNRVVKEVYATTTDGSILRRVIVHIYTCCTTKGNMTSEGFEPYPREFLLDLIKGLASATECQ